MSETTLAANFVAEARGELAACLARIKHCLGQLDEAQVWQRPRPSMNSVGNLFLHLSGNLRQRLLSVVGVRRTTGTGAGNSPSKARYPRLNCCAGWRRRPARRTPCSPG